MKPLKMIAQNDCVRTCIAALLDVSHVSEVPNFFENVTNPEDTDGWDRADAWLRKNHNLALFYFGAFADAGKPVQSVLDIMAEMNPGTYYMFAGNNERGQPHCVIALDNMIIHDPAWGSFGIRGPGPYGAYMIVTFIPMIVKAKSN